MLYLLITFGYKKKQLCLFNATAFLFYKTLNYSAIKASISSASRGIFLIKS